VVEFTTGSRAEVPGKRKLVIREEQRNNNQTPSASKNNVTTIFNVPFSYFVSAETVSYIKANNMPC
jgi:hypothetical protein